MKKIFYLIFLLFVSFSLTSCQNKDPLEKFIDEMNEKQSCEMLMEMNVPMIGKVRVKAEADGNKAHIEQFLLVPEMYTEEVDGVLYQYTQNESGKWEKNVQPTSDENEFEAVDILKYEDFDKNEDGTYSLKDDMKETYQVDAMTIEITEDGAIMIMEKTEQDLVLEISITITKIGEVTVTLPAVED